MDLSLKQLPAFSGRPGPLLFIVMDGIGLGHNDESNAVYMAKTPVLDALMKMPLFTRLKAHGTAVGLPSDDDMGNSEVGHNALGAGRIFDQGAKLVNTSIQSGHIFKTDLWNKIIKRGVNGNTIHFIGLLSDGNVHSHIDHLFQMIQQCAESGVQSVRVHALLDGRDVDECSALEFVKSTQELLDTCSSEHNVSYRFASGGGRMRVTMDRYNADWDIVKRGWDAHVHGIGRQFRSCKEAIETMYRENPDITDQYLDSFVIADNDGKPAGKITDGDGVVFYNFRGDRSIEISRAFEEENFPYFDRGRRPDVLYAGMMQYDGDSHIPKKYLVSPPSIENTVSEYLCTTGIKMFAVSETQKYGHVTYFWNGNRSGYICKDRETYIEIPSDKINFDKAPRMKAQEITTETIALLRSGEFRFGRINFPNGDMVGHSGVMDAAVEAVEAVDTCVGKLLDVIRELNGIAVVTADHGNSDIMWTEIDGRHEPKTAHTLNPVPFIIVDPLYSSEYKLAVLKTPGLTNITATLLNLLGYDKPDDYDPSLIVFEK